MVSVFLQQLLRRKCESLLLSACLEFARALRAADIKTPWQHFSRHYSPVVRLLGYFGAFVEAPPPLTRPHAMQHSFSGFGGGGVVERAEAGPGWRMAPLSASHHHWQTGLGGGSSGQAFHAAAARDDEDAYFGLEDDAEGRPAVGPLVGASGSWGGPVGGGASLLRGREAGALAEARGSDFDFAL